MNFRQLAISNIKGSRHRYAAFFLSSVFSVMIFFMFAAFVFHPDVVNGQIRAADKVRQGMIACQYLIVIFSFFFVWYASFAFLKSRKKEFGLFSLFGMTKGQISRLLFYENMTIAVLAIASGVGLGMLFSKIFLMALAHLLEVDSPIRFAVPLQALLYTGGGFLGLFLIITLMAMVSVSRSEIIALLRAAKQPKQPPVSSWWLVMLSLVCLVAGYGLAYTTSLTNIMVRMVVVLLLVVVGTYFLCTQASVAILGGLQRRERFYYRRVNLLTVAQLVFKIKDNARTLFMVTILSAVILTASGTLFVFHKGNRDQMIDYYPQAIGMGWKGNGVPGGISPEEAKRLLVRHGAVVERETVFEGVAAKVPFQGIRPQEDLTDAFLVSESEFNRAVAGKANAPSVSVKPGQVIYNFPYRQQTEKPLMAEGRTIRIDTGGMSLTRQTGPQVNWPTANRIPEVWLFVIMNDAEHKELMSRLPASGHLFYHGFDLKDWDQMGEASKALMQAVPAAQRDDVTSRIDIYLASSQSTALTLFIGLFVSFLFFIASGSLLYFKLFTELQEDHSQYKALLRMGVTWDEIKQIINVQVGLMFLIPVVVGSIHAAFAYKMLANLLVANLWSYGALVVSIYAVLQGGYILLTRRAYLQQMQRL